MTLYEKNIQELKSKYPIIYDAIKSVGTEDVSDIAHIEDARKGGQVVVYHDNGRDVIFIQVILHVDISELIKSKRVCLVVEGINTEGFSAAIEEWLDMANKDANKLLAAPKYMDLFHESYEAFRES